MLKEQGSSNLVQNMGNKGLVLRPRCNGPRRAQIQIPFNSIQFGVAAVSTLMYSTVLLSGNIMWMESHLIFPYDELSSNSSSRNLNYYLYNVPCKFFPPALWSVGFQLLALFLWIEHSLLQSSFIPPRLVNVNSCTLGEFFRLSKQCSWGLCSLEWCSMPSQTNGDSNAHHFAFAD